MVIIKTLVESGVDINGKYSDSDENPPRPLLFIVLDSGWFPAVQYLLDKGTNPNVVDHEGVSFLDRVKQKHFNRVVEYIGATVH